MSVEKNEPRVVQTFKILPALRADLQALAEKDGRTLSNYIERVLADHVEGKAKRRGK